MLIQFPYSNWIHFIREFKEVFFSLSEMALIHICCQVGGKTLLQKNWNGLSWAWKGMWNLSCESLKLRQVLITATQSHKLHHHSCGTSNLHEKKRRKKWRDKNKPTKPSTFTVLKSTLVDAFFMFMVFLLFLLRCDRDEWYIFFLDQLPVHFIQSSELMRISG